MKVLSPFILIKARKHLQKGHLITFPFAEFFWGYAVIFMEGGKGLWLLDFYSESQPYLPTEIPAERLKWRISTLFDKLDAWALAEEVQLSDWATSRTYIAWERDFLGQLKVDSETPSLGKSDLRAKLYGPKNVMYFANKDEVKAYPREYVSTDLGEFLMERLAEMECINGQEGWTPITPEALAKAKKPARPKPTGERRIEVYIFNYEKTLITDRGELEEEIQEAIGEDGFVSGGASVVNSRQEEGGHVDVECDSESYAKVLRGIRKVLFKFQCPANTAIADVVLMDDGTTKQKEFTLGESL